MSHRILIADDSQDTLEMLEVFLEFSGWKVYCASTLAEARARLDTDIVDAVILDRWFNDEDGLKLCRELKARLPQLPVVVISGAAYQADLEEAAKAGCDAYLVKPFDVDELSRVITQMLAAAPRKAAGAPRLFSSAV